MSPSDRRYDLSAITPSRNPRWIGSGGVSGSSRDRCRATESPAYLIAFKDQSTKPLIGPDGKTGEFDPRRAGCRLVVDDGLSQKLATIAGAGISSNSLWSVHQEIANGSLVRVLPDYEVDDRSVLWLVYPKSNILTVKVRTFIDFLLDKIGKSPVWLEP